MSRLPAPVTPSDAQLVWQSQTRPSARTVARALTQAGRRVHFTTVARWKREGWRSVPTQEHPLDEALRALDTAVPVLTGDEMSRAEDLVGKLENPPRMDDMTEAARLEKEIVDTARTMAAVSIWLRNVVDERDLDLNHVGEVALARSMRALAYAETQLVALKQAGSTQARPNR